MVVASLGRWGISTHAGCMIPVPANIDMLDVCIDGWKQHGGRADAAFNRLKTGRGCSQWWRECHHDAFISHSVSCCHRTHPLPAWATFTYLVWMMMPILPLLLSSRSAVVIAARLLFPLQAHTQYKHQHTLLLLLLLLLLPQIRCTTDRY